jgi:hypothetical protein
MSLDSVMRIDLVTRTGDGWRITVRSLDGGAWTTPWVVGGRSLCGPLTVR